MGQNSWRTVHPKKDSSVEGLEGVKLCSVMHEMMGRAPDVLD